MKKWILSCIVLVNAFAYGQQLSDAATISLLTGSPGTELYSTFGHSAIRVRDADRNLDIVFNYGTFDFNTPNFYLKFAQGKLLYKLSVEEFNNFQYGFQYENRSVVEQVLNLSISQKEQLYKLLLDNYKPENRYYKYDFFFDNCATRIRDLMPAAFGNDFRYNYPESWKEGKMTFRNLIDLYLGDHHWSDFGIDLALGMPTDGEATPADYMFLPDYLKEGFGTATIDIHGEEQPFVSSTIEIIPRKQATPSTFFITPVKLGWSIFVLTLALSVIGYKTGLRFNWYDMIFFSLIGLTGWVVFLLDFFTDHIATKNNLNMLWAVPVHFPVFLFWSKLPSRFVNSYIWIFLIINLLILLFWKVFPQNYHVAFIPLILSIEVRFLSMLRIKNTTINDI
jgi:hypothetical protein